MCCDITVYTEYFCVRLGVHAFRASWCMRVCLCVWECLNMMLMYVTLCARHVTLITECSCICACVCVCGNVFLFNEFIFIYLLRRRVNVVGSFMSCIYVCISNRVFVPSHLCVSIFMLECICIWCFGVMYWCSGFVCSVIVESVSYFLSRWFRFCSR